MSNKPPTLREINSISFFVTTYQTIGAPKRDIFPVLTGPTMFNSSSTLTFVLRRTCNVQLVYPILATYYGSKQKTKSISSRVPQKSPAQMIWGTFRTAPDKKRSKICTEKRPFPAASLKQRPDACILIEGTTPCGKSR
jgi:hypothetical protein